MRTIEESELVKRVMAAYRRATEDVSGVMQLPSAPDVQWNRDGTATVELSNVNGLLAKYEWNGTRVRLVEPKTLNPYA